jgi:hypothetical protein
MSEISTIRDVAPVPPERKGRPNCQRPHDCRAAHKKRTSLCKHCWPSIAETARQRGQRRGLRAALGNAAALDIPPERAAALALPSLSSVRDG